MPTHTLAEGEAILQTVQRLDLSSHIPGVIPVQLPRAAAQEGLVPGAETALNPAEFLYAMAQELRLIAREGQPGPVLLVSTKVSAAQRTCCVLVRPGGPRDSFIWRSDLPPAELDALWTRVPAPGAEQVAWASLPPLGDAHKPWANRPARQGQG
jgi:hypothetical protein